MNLLVNIIFEKFELTDFALLCFFFFNYYYSRFVIVYVHDLLLLFDCTNSCKNHIHDCCTWLSQDVNLSWIYKTNRELILLIISRKFELTDFALFCFCHSRFVIIYVRGLLLLFDDSNFFKNHVHNCPTRHSRFY